MDFIDKFQADETPSSAHVSCIKYDTPVNGEFPPHCHYYYEISFVTEGKRFEICNGKSFSAENGTLFFYPPLAVHSNKNIERTEVIVIQFSPEFICGNVSPKYWNSVLRPIDDSRLSIGVSENIGVQRAAADISKFCDSHGLVFGCKELGLTEVFERNALILRLLSAMLGAGFLEATAAMNNPIKVPMLDSVINYILSHPSEKTDMRKAAEMAHMSYYSFSRFFKEAVGINFTDYCNRLRIRYAEDMLVKTDMSVSDIGLSVGIGVPSYFSRIFRRCNGMSPAEFRLANKLMDSNK